MAETLQEFILGIAFGKLDEKPLERAKALAEKAAKESADAYKAAAKKVEEAQEAVKKASDAAAKKIARDALDTARTQAKAAREAANAAKAAYKETEKASKEAADKQKENSKRILDSWNTIGKAGAAALVGGVVAGTHAIVEQATAIRDWSARLGDGADTLQQIAGAAKLLGVDSEIAFKAIQKLRLGIGEGTAAAPLAAIGLDANTLAGMDAKGQLAAIADGLATVGSDAERTAISVRLFGEEGGKLVPVLAGTSVGFEQLIDSATEAGAVMSGEALENALLFDRELNELTIKAKAFAATTIGEAIPAVVDFGSDVATLAGAVVDLGDAFGEAEEEEDEWLTLTNAALVTFGIFTAIVYGSVAAVDALADAFGTLNDEMIKDPAARARAEIATELAKRQGQILTSNKLIGQSHVATANVHVQESVRLGEQASKIVKGRKKGGARKKTEIEFTAEDFEFDELHGDELRRLAAQGDVGEVAISAAIKAGGDAVRQGHNDEVARKAALSRLGSSTGQDYSKTASKDPMMSEIFGENVPDIELSKLAMGAQPQTLIATINNTFQTEINNEINGAGNPADIASAVVQTFKTVIEGTIAKSTKTAGVPWAR